MDLVCFGQQNWDVCFGTKQHLMTRLAQRGHRVLYVDPDTAAAASDSVAATAPPQVANATHQTQLPPAVRELAANLLLFSYSASPRSGKRVTDLCRQWALRRALQQLGMQRAVALVLKPQHPLRRWGIEPAALVYFGEDEWTAFQGYTPRQRAALRRHEEALLRQCDLALAVSTTLLERFRAIQPRCYLQENGVEAAHFAPASLAAAAPDAALATLDRPRIGLIGQIDERVDVDLLGDIAATHRQWQFVLVGRVTDPRADAALRDKPNIHRVGFRTYGELPGVLGELDVLMVPYRLTPLTRACNPLKVYEYLATGKPVVTTPLPGLQSAGPVVSRAATPAAFARCIADALAAPQQDRDARLAFAQAQDWQKRTDHLEARLLEALQHRRTRSKTAAPAATALDAKEQTARQFNAPQPPSAMAGLLQKLTSVAGLGYYALRRIGRAMSRCRPRDVRRILIARRGFMGDTLALLPMLHALRLRYPQARIVLAVAPETRFVTAWREALPVDELRVLDWLKGSGPQRLRGMVRLFVEGFDLLITGHSYFLFTAAFFCGAPRRVGLDDGDPRQRWLTRRVPLAPYRHEADNNLAVAEALGAVADPRHALPRLDLPPGALDGAWQQVRTLLALPEATQLVTVHPGSKRLSRRWPVERFAEVIELMLREHPQLRVVLSGVAGEEALEQAITQQVTPALHDRLHSVIGRTSISELTALLARSRLVLSNDTGTMHLAQALGRPLVALLGPENHERWGPYPLCRAPTIALRRVVPCAPCDRHMCDALYCLKSLAVDDVLGAVQELLAADAPERAEESLLPVDMRVRHLTWQDLSAHAPAAEAVLIVMDWRGRSDAARQAMLTQVQQQDYPHLTCLALIDGESAQRDTPAPGGKSLRTLALTGSDMPWQHIAHAGDEPFVAWCDRPDDWARGLVSSAVAQLQRVAKGAAATDGRLLVEVGLRELGHTNLDGWVFRRAFLSRLQRHDAATGSSAVAAPASLGTVAG